MAQARHPGTEAAPLRVVLAEDGVLIREGIAGLLRRFGYDVVAEVDNADRLRDAVSAYRPALVVTDVRMPPGLSDEGLVAAIALREAYPELAVLVLSQYIEVTYAGELLDSESEAGVGYLLKDRIGDVAQFQSAVERVAAGGTVIDPLVVKRLVRRNRDPLEALSAREQEVLALMAEGQSNAAVARSLVVSEAAVAKHVTGIFTKLGLVATEDANRRVMAVLRYLRSGARRHA